MWQTQTGRLLTQASPRSDSLDDGDDDDDDDDGDDVDDDNHRALTFAMKCLPADRKDLGLDYLLSLSLTLVITENIVFCISVLIS